MRRCTTGLFDGLTRVFAQERMNKIGISSVSEDVFTQRGFASEGCYGSSCKDACCVYGCDVDRESYNLIFKNRQLIEPAVGMILEDCFEQDWSADTEYLGGNSIRAHKGNSGFCVFHAANAKGCVLYILAGEMKIPRRIIPSICRLYPLTWDNGIIRITEDFKPTCDCRNKGNISLKNLFDTQKKEIEDIFEFFSERSRV